MFYWWGDYLMIKDDYVLLMRWKIYPGLPWWYCFNMLTPVFTCAVWYHVHWVLVAFNNIYLFFSHYHSVFVKCDHSFIVAQSSNWNENWVQVGDFSACLPVLIHFEVGFGLDEWIPLLMNWVVSLLLDFLMSPWCWLMLLGHSDSCLYIMSQKLDHLHVILVGVDYYY